MIKAIETGFNELKVCRIEALVDPDNIASRRVLEKVIDAEYKDLTDEINEENSNVKIQEALQHETDSND